MLTRQLVTQWLRAMMWLLCRIDAADLARVPLRGPLIMVSNHINFVEMPVLYTQLRTRPVAVLAKTETWDNPAMGWLFNTLGGSNAIPVRRGEADKDALRKALAKLEDGCILGLAPEGTRSGNGRLQRGQPGVVLLALHSGAPILPVVFYGGERIWHNLPRVRRTDFHIRVGQPFRLDPGAPRVTRAMRQQMTDEIMWQMAALLPPPYRGVYADLDAATRGFLRYADGSSH